MSDCKSNLDRRGFLKLGGLTLLVSAINPDFVRAHGDPRLERLRTAGSGKTFVYVFQRGACDTLNVTIPTEANEYSIYQSFRPSLQVAMPDLTPQQLTPDFALHPVLRTGLYDLWTKGHLAVFPNVGYPNASRSHFDSQKFIDNGTPFNKATPDGWLNRYMQLSPATGNPLRAISFSNALPFSMIGSEPAMAFQNLSQLTVSPNPARDQKFLDIQKQVYGLPDMGRPWDPEVVSTGASLISAIEAIRSSNLPAPSVTYPTGAFPNALSQLAQLIRSRVFDIEIAEIDIGGWDTHAQQQIDTFTGTFQGLLAQFSDGLKAFHDDLGPLMDNVVVLTVSEFGRTARENGNRGTDHGSAWTSFAFSGANGPVRPGVYFGPGGWYGLSDLRDNRDLKHSLDFRDLFSEVLSRHLGGLDPSIFPGWTYTPVGYL